MIASTVGFALCVIALVDTLSPGGPRLPGALLAVPGATAFVSTFAVLYTINSGKLGQIPLDKLWPVLRALPLAFKITLPVLLVAVGVNYFTASSGIVDVGDFERMMAGNVAWLNIASCALALGVLRKRARDAESPTLPTSKSDAVKRKYRLMYTAASVAIGIVLVVLFLLQPDRISDNRKVHDDLTARFGSTSWYPHLKAANLDHNAFHVYLDANDAETLAAACLSLMPYGNHVPDLYYLHQGKATYIQSCR